MAYTLDSSFLSAPVGMTAQWMEAIRPHNPLQAESVAAAYVRYGADIGINADLALAQACHECAWFTARRWREQCNPARLGVTSGDARGPTFLSAAQGIQAHYEHLVCYTMTGNPPIIWQWGLHDPRHTFFDGKPRVRDLIRPERRWAVPGDGYPPVSGYPAAIVRIANQVTGGTTMTTATPPPTTEEIGYPTRVHAAAPGDIGPARGITAIKWFIVHDTEGYFAGDENVLTSAAPPVASAHALIGRDGALVAMVPLDRTAWTPGNDAVARVSVNVELSGFATEPYTEAQYRALAAYYRWCVRQGMTVPAAYVGKEDRPGICGHQDVADPEHPGQWGGASHHTDPGPLFDWNRLVARIRGEDAPRRLEFFVPENPYGRIPLRPPFWNRWNALAERGLALPMMGYPTAAERALPDGRRVQRFERGWFGTQDAEDPWNLVALLPEEWPAASA